MVRVIVNREKNCRWSAHWLDDPQRFYRSASISGAVAKLIIHSPDRNIAPSDLVYDPAALRSNYVEMVVMEAR